MSTDRMTPTSAFEDDTYWEHTHPRRGFFTDTSICIGCKACEVACKEWNRNPADSDYEILGSSYDNTGGLGADTWRHVAFIEQSQERVEQARESGRALVNLGMPRVGPPAASSAPSSGGCACGPAAGDDVAATASQGGACGSGGCACGSAPAPDDAAGPGCACSSQSTPGVTAPVGCGSGGGCGGGAAASSSSGAPGTAAEDSPVLDTPDFRWLMSSDVCKHCTHAGCLDVCPTGALFRTEFGTVVVQEDICNGCGTCVAGCPFGVIERRNDGLVEPKTQRGAPPMPDTVKVPQDGIAQKCTLCYDRMKNDQTPACAQACPTTSIKYGERESMLETAQHRVTQLHEQGKTEARLYGANPKDGVGGTGSIFLLLDEPEVYGLPPDPRVPTADLPRMYKRAGAAVLGMLALGVAAFTAGDRS
ncbi:MULTISPECIES: 4Fe-4S dicluster domain-containing protein [Kocuria]|uniref:Formate dehydrogenase, nitrate-inducible, iron-sulfur subunit n=2 Tax=Kocuria TaxID=57493 RepID=A0A7D7L2Y6_KOCVA|nr:MULTISPECIES: 4Fe-4S dicluster domain-containing protein [Kocuria]MDN5630327.1 4Fe-4S dicluster domain-containing protein [Kocuria sp.]QMS57628.1 Formate dehydrogenase, nitrate-inducible, iron-sulfur subunit [Kocuria varians]RUP84603.1 4Fe-4S dicluster domain-containing protein [Kocuria sp. HSID17590]